MTELKGDIKNSYLKEIEGALGEKGASVNQLCSNDKVFILQKLGLQFGVNVAVLQKDGEEYTYHSTDSKTNKSHAFRGVVPKGESYIRITSERNDISDFWDAVRARDVHQKNSLNSPKI